MKLRILTADDVKEALPMAEAIAGMKQAFAQLSAGNATVPLRSRIPVPNHEGVSLVMPAYLAQSNDLAVKVVGVFPHNVRRQEPIIYATVLVLEAATGRPMALVEGGSLTAIRTGAGSGVATALLATPEAKVAAILGSGAQARTQLEAVCTVRPVVEVRVFSPNSTHAMRFAQQMAGRGPMPDAIHVTSSPSEAIRGADIICTATTSASPVFAGLELKPGAHINAIGSYTPSMQEVDLETIRRSLVVVDSREAALAEAGDLIIPLRTGLIGEDHIHAELGEILNGQRSGRTEARQITYFKSVGVAVQDAVAGRIVLQNAETRGLGNLVDF